MRHIIDQAHRRRQARVKRFARVLRRDGETLARVAQALRRKPRNLSEAIRLRQYGRLLHRGL